MRARRSSSSPRERSVPWRRSTKGETTARGTSARPGLQNLSARRSGCKLRRESKGGQAKQDPQEQPKVGVHYEILVRLHPGIGNGNKKNTGVPENHEGDGEQGRSP